MQESKTSGFNDENLTNEYATSDLKEAAFLAVLGFSYEFDRRNPRQVAMIFQGDCDLIQLKLRDFWNNSTKVDARSVLICFTEMKKAIIGENYRQRPVDSIYKNEGEGVAKIDN